MWSETGGCLLRAVRLSEDCQLRFGVDKVTVFLVWTSQPLNTLAMPSPRSRSRSPSPRREERRRSRSPRRRRDDDRPKRGGGGFKWKERRRDEEQRGEEGERRLERGYRDRERPRSPVREKASEDVAIEKSKKEKKERKEKKAAASSAPTGEPMIIVNINDRLGTKAAIPCLASDPISKDHDSAPCSQF